MRTCCVKNGLVMVVILLFVGIAVQPAIAREETQEYTLITPSIFGIKNQKMRLTSEQSNKLDSIFDDLQAQLQTVESGEDTKILFKRTIDSLVRNNLLSPSDAYLTKKLLFSSIVDWVYSALNKKLNIDTDVENKNCWIVGKTNYSRFFRPILRFPKLFSILFFWLDELYYLFAIPIYMFLLNHLSPIVFFADISFGYYQEGDHWRTNAWSYGWVRTKNILNLADINGPFRGGLSKVDFLSFSADISYCFLGVYSFLGIGYNNKDDREQDYFFGRAALVDINEK